MRQATPADIPRLVEMGREFHAASNQLCPYDGAAISKVLENMIASEDAAVFVSEAGVIGGVLNPAYCAPEWVMAVELFWWATDRRGLALLKAFEDWARDKGAQEVRMTTLTNLPAADKILRRKGYGAMEISYGKAI